MAIQQLAYLKSRFENGDFPDQTDFFDLIDSSYNYSLSVLPDFFAFVQPLTGNWENTYATVQTNSAVNWNYQGQDLKALSANWENTYSTVSSNSADWKTAYEVSNALKNLSGGFATVQYANSTFVPASGGTITNSLNVAKKILSGSSDLFDLFLAKPNDFQKLAFNKSTENLSITNGNTVSLSALASYANFTMGHSLFNPVTSTTYHFGAIPTITPSVLNRLSRSFISQYDGSVVEASITSSFESSSASNEDSIFTVVNRTKNTTSVITSAYKYFDTISSFVSQTLRGGTAPGGWTSTSIVYETAEGGYARFDSQVTSNLQSPAFDGRSYARITVQFKVALFGDEGEPGPATVEYSLNGASGPWIVAGNSPTPGSSSVYLDASIDITEVSNNMSIRVKRNTSASALRIRDLAFVGISGDGAQIDNYVLASPLAINKGDLLEIEWETPAWATPPINVINIVNAKVKIAG